MSRSEDQLRENLAELEQRMIDVNEEVELIRSRYGSDPGRMPAGQAQRLDNLTRGQERSIREYQEVQARVDQYDVIRRNASLGYTESTTIDDRPTRRPRRGDPWKSNDDSADGYISRAHSALELVVGPSTEDRNRIADLIDAGAPESRDLAHYIARTSHPDYLSAFLKVMRNPAMGSTMFSPAETQAWQQTYGDTFIARTAMSLTGQNGGYLVPMTLDPTVILTNSGVIDPIRRIARQVSIVTDDWSGVSSSGVSAEWLTEGSEAADATPTFSQPVITPKKAAAWVYGSYEVMADSAFGAEIGRLLMDAKTRLEAVAFATGNTGASRPRGIVAAVAAVTASLVSSATISSFVIGDVYRVSDAITPRASANVSWLASKTILNKVRQFDTTGGSAFWSNLGAGIPPTLLGDPVYECSSMGTVVTTSANILLAGDFKEFVIVDRVGMAIVHDPVVKSTGNGRPTGQSGFFGFFRVGSDVTNVDAFRMLTLHTTPSYTPLG